jgi:hypothetical protein
VLVSGDGDYGLKKSEKRNSRLAKPAATPAAGVSPTIAFV